MSQAEYADEIDRIRKEYDRRAKEIPEDYYSLEKPANRFFYEGRLKAAKILLEQENFFPMTTKKIFEIGCGTGGWLPDFQAWGADPANLCGMDLDEHRIAKAGECLPKADLRVAEASRLPWSDRSFDIVVQSTVFSSILLVELRRKIAAEMLRVLKPGGIVLWYDFFWNNPRNPNVRGIKADEIREFFPGCEINLEKITLAPPLARILAPMSFSFCRFLEILKFLNTHYIASIRLNP